MKLDTRAFNFKPISDEDAYALRNIWYSDAPREEKVQTARTQLESPARFPAIRDAISAFLEHEHADIIVYVEPPNGTRQKARYRKVYARNARRRPDILSEITDCFESDPVQINTVELKFCPRHMQEKYPVSLAWARIHLARLDDKIVTYHVSVPPTHRDYFSTKHLGLAEDTYIEALWKPENLEAIALPASRWKAIKTPEPIYPQTPY